MLAARMSLQTPVPTLSDKYWSSRPKDPSEAKPGTPEYFANVKRSAYGPPREAQTITIPGWDSIIKTGPRVQTTGPQWSEYFKAIRENRPPKLTPEVVQAIDQARANMDANRTSAQPEWAKTFGGVMTTIDNVQDFASTIATAARLFLWAGSKIVDKAVPGLTAEAAELSGRIAGSKYAAKLAAQLGGRAGWNSAFIDAAARAVARQATSRALLGLGARLALRAVPVVGWIVLVADLLNMMNLLGSVAMPLYGLICRSPQEALAAGIPAALLKNALCKEVWTMTRLNPFSREARAARALAARGRLPTVSNLVEVVQTTDTLFGWGMSFGSLYGAAMETLFAAANDPTFENTKVNFDVAITSVGVPYRKRLMEMSEAKARHILAAADVARTAPYVLTKQQHIDDETHYLTMAALLGAYGDLYEFFKDGPQEELLAAMSTEPVPAPNKAPDWLMAALDGQTYADAGIGLWPVPGTPSQLYADELLPQLAAPIGQAVRDFMHPRRNEPACAFFGAAVNQLCDYGWMLATNDPNVLKWNLAPDTKLLTGMAVDGLLIRTDAPEQNAWRFWEGARELLDQRGGKLLHSWDLEPLAKKTGTPLVKLLAPDAPYPPAFLEWAHVAEHNPESLPG
jgi:hypothetical protein